jgi:predicted DNA-binding transcriptional regulator YafY
MSDRSHRLFEIIQALRLAKNPLTARALAELVEVTPRTIYRDIVTLQATGVPIEGAAGLGYVMRSGYDLPPLMFTAEEIEAIAVGLSLIGRTADTDLLAAAAKVAAKIRTVMPADGTSPLVNPALLVSHWNEVPVEGGDYRLLRQAIREERKLSLRYADEQGRRSDRIVLPVALVYYVDNALLAAWCELRGAFRHFRVDRIEACRPIDATFIGKGTNLRETWQATHQPFGR